MTAPAPVKSPIPQILEMPWQIKSKTEGEKQPCFLTLFLFLYNDTSAAFLGSTICRMFGPLPAGALRRERKIRSRTDETRAKPCLPLIYPFFSVAFYPVVDFFRP